MSRSSTCRASTHAAWMRAGTVGQWERTWKSVTAVLAHGASRPARCSIPRRCPSHSSRSTYAARSQLSGGDLTPDKVSNTLRDEGSMASTVSASDARMRRSDARLRFVPEVIMIRAQPRFLQISQILRLYTTDDEKYTHHSSQGPHHTPHQLRRDRAPCFPRRREAVGVVSRRLDKGCGAGVAHSRAPRAARLRSVIEPLAWLDTKVKERRALGEKWKMHRENRNSSEQIDKKSEVS